MDMSTLEKQNEFDKKKWVDSVNAGRDTCGEYEYCSKCNKAHEYPCATAYDNYASTLVVEEKPVAKTTKVKKTCAKKSTTAKKTTTKKTTAKKTTKKATK